MSGNMTQLRATRVCLGILCEIRAGIRIYALLWTVNCEFPQDTIISVLIYVMANLVGVIGVFITTRNKR